jgi:hypothetical protein
LLTGPLCMRRMHSALSYPRPGLKRFPSRGRAELPAPAACWRRGERLNRLAHGRDSGSRAAARGLAVER